MQPVGNVEERGLAYVFATGSLMDSLLLQGYEALMETLVCPVPLKCFHLTQVLRLE